jgi:hypothetical protein
MFYRALVLGFAMCNYYDQVKEEEMSKACSTKGGEEECI